MPSPRDLRNYQEAGIALLCGEIGELLSRLEQFKAELPGVVEQGTRELNTSIIAIVKATKGAHAAIEHFSEAQQRRLADVQDQAQSALREEVRELREAIASSAAGLPSPQSSPQPTRRYWVLAAVGALVISLLAGASAYVGASLALERQHHAAGSVQAAQ